VTPPRIPFLGLSTLWIQITGFVCNLECAHCLVSASPRNHALGHIPLADVRRHVADAEALGVRDIYLTGGEPFLHAQIIEVLDACLRVAPTTVLTNGTLITDRVAGELAELSRRTRYTLELRVSLDSPVAEENDRVRGAGSFEKALRAIQRLDARGLPPILTATEYCLETGGAYARFRDLLLAAGVRRPRVKILPVFATGKLEGTRDEAPLTPEMLEGYDVAQLQCSDARVVTSSGIDVCPILVNLPEGRVPAASLFDAIREPVSLAHHACRTCYVRGATCRNY
jgi:MoaA/NifB/PqqE/SkfB family radical SAM enzyme